jgi:UDP-glucuronate decarboxylase
MNLLLSGGTGFFGRAFLDYLQSHHDQHPSIAVCVLTRSTSRFLELYPRFASLPWLKLFQCDLLEPSSLPRDRKFSHVIHAATEATRSSVLDYKRQYFEIIDGARNVLDLAIQSDASRFLMISSGAAYGLQPSAMNKISETWTGSPPLELASSAYGLGKRAAEHMCALYHDSHGLDYSIARCFAFVGPDLPLNAHYAIGNFIFDALSGRDIIVKGDGLPLRSYLYQADLARWLYTLLLHGRDGETYNVGSDVAISIGDLAKLVCSLIDPSRSVLIRGESTGIASASNYVPSVSKVVDEFDLRVETSLRDAILLTANWQRNASRGRSL